MEQGFTQRFPSESPRLKEKDESGITAQWLAQNKGTMLYWGEVSLAL